MSRYWILWTLLLALTCGLAAGCAPDSGKPGGNTTDGAKK
jgi:hypothetical protein